MCQWLNTSFIQPQAAKQYSHKPVYQPVDGQVFLPELPGLGLVLDEAKINEHREMGLPA